MTWFALALGLWVGGAALVFLVRRRGTLATVLSLVTTVAGAACLGIAAAHTLGGAPETWDAAWGLPFGRFALRLDALCGVFLVPIAVIGALGAIYAAGYQRLEPRLPDAPPPGLSMAAYEFLLATMALVATAANTVVLLIAWELMTVSSWVLITRHHDAAEVRSAGLFYLVAGQVSAAALLLAFVLLSLTPFGWTVPSAAAVAGPGLPAPWVLALLCGLGFGTKAALAPLHVWLPGAHAAAPSHVSALLSGVLITLGFYGLLRFLPAVGPPSVLSGVVFVGLGALGAAGGIVMALSQRDIKRVLAYSTIENAGLMALAIGVAQIALAQHQPAVAALAWTALLLHTWDHALAKSLLFFTAGAMAKRIGSRDLERWGGALRRMPIHGAAFLVGAAALIGLPGLYGFAGEWLLFMSLVTGSQALPGALRLTLLVGVLAVAFAAGTALACFVRAAGVGLLGHPRSAAAATPSPERGAWLALPVLILAASCYALAAAAPVLVSLLGPAVEQLAPGADVSGVRTLVAPLPWLALLLPLGVATGLGFRAWLLARRPLGTGETWACGYAHPGPSMQYTASSLAQPTTRVLQPALRTAVEWSPPRGPWPRGLSWHSRTPERALAEVYRPAFVRLGQWLGVFSRLQEGRLMVYLRYVGIALLVLLAWLLLPASAIR